MHSSPTPTARASSPTPTARASSPTPTARALGVATLVVIVQALLLMAFAWPAAETGPRDLPLVVAGPQPAATEVAGSLGAAQPGAFEVTTVPDRATAEQAVRDRDAYGAIVLDPTAPAAPTTLVASAASPAVAALLTQAAEQRAAEAGRGAGPAVVEDIVPADPDDPRGATLAAGVLPLVVTSIAVGAALALAVRRRGAVLLGLVTYATLSGLLTAMIMQLWLGVLPASFLTNAAVIGLVALAISAAVAGAGMAFGRVGLGLTAATVFLLGIPLSGLASAPEMLPQPWGAIGQLLPPGAGGSLLRSVAWFDAAGAAVPLTVLATWAVVGLLLVAIARRRTAEGENVAVTTEAQPISA